MARGNLSIVDKLLRSALDLERSGKKSFSGEDLVIAAWRLDPSAFGLQGYQDEEGRPLYPNSHRVYAEIMGSKPIRKRGLLRKIGTKRYELTESGRELALLLENREDGSPLKKAGLSEEVQDELRRILISRAFEKFGRGDSEEITFYDACSFWGISPRSSAIELDGRLANLQKVLRIFYELTTEGPVSLRHGGEPILRETLDRIGHLDDLLRSRFSAELSIIDKRRSER
ncbi:MAG: hypothetical protein ACREX3_01610 [Gammaproteobacteria bacterium]